MTVLHSRIGFEIELIAPAGASRKTLADRIAREHEGHVTRLFHTDSEPSLVPGMGHFWHLTPGYAVSNRAGKSVASLVDDVTLVADLRREQAAMTEGGGAGRGATTAPDPHAYRILSDDARLLRLVADHTHPDTPFAAVLDRAASVFGTTVETIGTVRRLRDRTGASIALATELAPGRDRPCEIVTPPLEKNHETALEALLQPARDLEFTVPQEAAVHMHLDAAPFRSVAAFSNLVRLFGHWREALRIELGTNPSCTRLQPLPPELVAHVDSITPSHSINAINAGEWRSLQKAGAEAGLTKYFDINLTALLIDQPARDTIEVRTLPGSLHTSEIMERAQLVERLLDRCLEAAPFPLPTTDNPVSAAAELRALARIIPAAANGSTR